MTLYEIDQALLECVDPETGEVVDFDQLDALTMAREAKIEGVAMWVKSLEAETIAIREEEKALASRRKAKENKVERLREYLKYSLGGQPFETAKVALSFRASTSLKVTDERTLVKWLEANHDDCLSYKEPTILKNGVAQLIKWGKNVPGCELETRQNLQMR